MRDPVQEGLSRGRSGPLNCVPLLVSVQEDVPFRNLGDPTAIELDPKLQSPQLTTNRERSRGSGDLARCPRRFTGFAGTVCASATGLDLMRRCWPGAAAIPGGPESCRGESC